MLARYLLSSCVRRSVRHKPVLYRNDWTNRAGIWHTGFLPSSPHFLCYKEISVSPKIRVLPSETLSQTPDQENFSTASRSRCQQHSSSTVEFVDDTYTTVDESWLFTTIDQLHCCDLLWICCTTGHRASRGPSAVSEPLVSLQYEADPQCFPALSLAWPIAISLFTVAF